MTPKTILLAAAVLTVAFVPLAALHIVSLAALVKTIGAAGLLLGVTLLVRDKALTQTKALPNGANTINTDGFDIGVDPKGDFLSQMEVIIEAPALTVTELADTQTITYSIYHDTASNFGSEAALYPSLIVQTGAGGAGCAAATKQVRLPVDCNRYVRVKAVKAGASNASTSSVAFSFIF